MVLSNNVKNLVILIPNEAHEPYELKVQQLINQPFIPQHVRMNLGTTIVFFNADVVMITGKLSLKDKLALRYLIRKYSVMMMPKITRYQIAAIIIHLTK
jgi:hypothetical protein